AFKARLVDASNGQNEPHFVTGWRPIDASDPPQKTRGRMPFGAWNADEGLKLNLGDNGLTPNFGDSGGGASVVHTTSENATVDIYEGVISTKVTGWFFPGVQCARIPFKVSWIENVASPLLGPAINCTAFTTVPTSQHPSPLAYVRASAVP